MDADNDVCGSDREPIFGIWVKNAGPHGRWLQLYGLPGIFVASQPAAAAGQLVSIATAEQLEDRTYEVREIGENGFPK